MSRMRIKQGFSKVVYISIPIFLILIPIGIGIGIVLILTSQHLPDSVNYQATDLIINAILTILLLYLYWSMTNTQSDQLAALQSQSSNLDSQAASMKEIAEIQRQQEEIMEYQRLMMEQQYRPDLRYTSIDVDGNQLMITLQNQGAGIATDISLEAGIEKFGSEGYITNESAPLAENEPPPSILRPGEEVRYVFPVRINIPREDGLEEVGVEHGLREVDHDGAGGRWVRMRILYRDSGNDQYDLRLVEYPRELVGDLSLDGVLGLGIHGEIPDNNRREK